MNSLRASVLCVFLFQYGASLRPPDLRKGSLIDIPRCLEVPPWVQLTEDERVLAGRHVCLPVDGSVPGGSNAAIRTTRRGVPPNVECEEVEWCDDTACSTICKRGSVQVSEWLREAHRLQHRLSASLPLCYSSWFGTHNSAITLADGYGNLDPLYESMFDYVKWLTPIGSSSVLRTNDQYFSLTDQLNMGVRMIEIDTHWVEGCLRVAHCGGLHVDALNKFVKVLNVAAKVLGYDIRWDTETVGCDPSLSSIPAQDQRTLIDALKEIREWMEVESNKDQFLIVYFDDEPDLKPWVRL